MEQHPKMNPEVKQKWIDALRSGDYNQGYGRLKSNFGFCCLGVLCDLHSRDNWSYRSDNRAYEHDYESQYAGPNVSEWANIDWKTQKCLSTLNDNGKTFSEIATYIEENL